MNLCTTALITSYDVQLDFDHNGLRYSICTTNVSTDITNISMSQYFLNHPMSNANYKATIFAVNERGRGPSSVQGNLAITLANTGLLLLSYVYSIFSLVYILHIHTSFLLCIRRCTVPAL